MKKLYLLFISVCCNLNVLAQATSMTVDCQTPGWLSSMINYEDQITLKNIKVTGYINAKDLSFLGTLNRNQQLNGVINLEDVQIVGTTNADNNIISKGYFGGHIQHFILPKSLVSATNCLSGPSEYSDNTTVDTLTIGGEALPSINSSMFYKTIYEADGIRFNKFVKHLILREGVTTIERRAFYNGDMYQNSEEECVFQSVVFPKTIKTIGDYSFFGCYKLKFVLPEGIEEIGDCSFQNTPYLPDTLKLPESLKVYYMSAFPIKENQVIIIPQYVEQVYNYKKSYNNSQNIYYYSAYLTSENCSSIYIYAINPPTVIDYSGNSYSGIDSGRSFKGFTIYVPKGTSSDYKSAMSWKNATIIENIQVEEIKVNELPKYIYVGDNYTLEAEVKPSEALDKTILWSSSDEDIATISQEGLLTTKKAGEVVITAQSVDETISDNISLQIYDHTTGIILSSDYLKLKIGTIDNLQASTLPFETSDGQITWSTNNDMVAKVDEYGRIKGVGRGSCTITATSVDGGFTATCEVTVIQPVEAATLEIHGLEMKVGEKKDLYCNLLPATADNKVIVWQSSDDNIATVDNHGSVTALKAGTAYIRAISEDNPEAKDSCKVTVLQPVTGITLNYSTYEVSNIGESFVLEATITPEDASNKDIKWTSSDEGVCMVANGTVVVTGYGTCVIIASTTDGNYVATCTINSVSTGIKPINSEGTTFEVYDINGVMQKTLRQGMNIIRMSDGTVKKVVVK